MGATSIGASTQCIILLQQPSGITNRCATAVRSYIYKKGKYSRYKKYAASQGEEGLGAAESGQEFRTVRRLGEGLESPSSIQLGDSVSVWES